MADTQIPSESDALSGAIRSVGTLLSGVFLLVYCLWQFAELSRLDPTATMQLGGGLPADAYPRLLAYGLFLCGVLLTLNGALTVWRARRSLGDVWWTRLASIILFLVQLSLFVFLFQRLGFLLSSAFFMIGLNWWISGRFRLGEAGVIVAVLAGLMLLLKVGFGIVLPTGYYVEALAAG
jgi:hypothetical protein